MTSARGHTVVSVVFILLSEGESGCVHLSREKRAPTSLLWSSED